MAESHCLLIGGSPARNAVRRTEERSQRASAGGIIHREVYKSARYQDWGLDTRSLNVQLSKSDCVLYFRAVPLRISISVSIYLDDRQDRYPKGKLALLTRTDSIKDDCHWRLKLRRRDRHQRFPCRFSQELIQALHSLTRFYPSVFSIEETGPK